MTVDVKRSAERFATKLSWLDAKHSFSFGRHWDEANTHHGLLLVSNEDRIKPDTGFDTHPHRDMEIVTWVIDGELEHKDSHGHAGIIYPGLAQRMSAGSGIFHSEMNRGLTDTSATSMRPRGEVHLVQMWVVPDTERIEPGYDQLDINDALNAGGFVPVASGRAADQAAIPIQQKNARLVAARMSDRETLTIPDAPWVHLFVTKGAVDLEDAGRIEQGDAVRLAGAGARTVTAASLDTEILVWEMHASLG